MAYHRISVALQIVYFQQEGTRKGKIFQSLPFLYKKIFHFFQHPTIQADQEKKLNNFNED